MAKADLTALNLRDLLSYNPGTGKFLWLPRTGGFSGPRASAIWHSRYCGKYAGGTHKATGYITIMGHLAHRLAWLYVTGSWPAYSIDHINGNRADNRIVNLRDVPIGVNVQNIRRAPRKESDLPLGVYFNSRKKSRPYSSSLRIDNSSKHLGYFDTAEQAHLAYLQAKRIHHAGFIL